MTFHVFITTPRAGLPFAITRAVWSVVSSADPDYTQVQRAKEA